MDTNNNNTTKNVHGKVEDWHRSLNEGVAPIPWKSDDNGNIFDALGRPLFIPNLISISQGFVNSNIDNAKLICKLVNGFISGDYNLQHLQSIVVEWADLEFPERVPSMALLKMFSEIGEVIDNPSDATEWADVLILFLDVAKLSGVSGDDLTMAFIEKMKVNKNRKWNVKNGLGVISHMPDDSSQMSFDFSPPLEKI